MKYLKYVSYILLAYLFIPTVIYAQEYTEDFEIKAKVNLEGKELEDKEFSFVLLDYKDNIIDTAYNDKDGNIVFKKMQYTFFTNDNGWLKKYDKENTFLQLKR